nr:MAG TPA: hypothetical protein [Caudoviricetes sp.]
MAVKKPGRNRKKWLCPVIGHSIIGGTARA